MSVALLRDRGGRPRRVERHRLRVAPEREAIDVWRLGRIVDRRQCGLQQVEAVGRQDVAQVIQQVAGVPGIADPRRLLQLGAEQQGLQPAERGDVTLPDGPMALRGSP
jgi:hypothetical protein